MDPFDRDRRRRRRKNPFDFISDEEFEQLFDEMRKIFESTDFKEIIKDMLRESFDSNERITQGFNINIEPVATPNNKRENNRPLKISQKEFMDYEEYDPSPDVIEGDEEISITVDLPGAIERDIDLNATEQFLEMAVDTPHYKYHRLVDLPCDVQPKTLRSTYRNGVLDIRLKRKK
jgi:HSP20 family protein